VDVRGLRQAVLLENPMSPASKFQEDLCKAADGENGIFDLEYLTDRPFRFDQFAP
jgi:hypothetical protein